MTNRMVREQTAAQSYAKDRAWIKRELFDALSNASTGLNSRAELESEAERLLSLLASMSRSWPAHT